MIIAGKAVDSNYGFIYLRSEYPLAYDRLSLAIKKCYKNNLLGENLLNSNFNFDIELRKGAGSYICGEETALLESLEGKRGTITLQTTSPCN